MPALGGHVDADKDVAREQWCCDALDPAGMALLFAIARQIDLETLAAEMLGGLQLGVGMGLRYVPAASRRPCVAERSGIDLIIVAGEFGNLGGVIH